MDSSGPHEMLKDYVEKILLYYGFDVKREYALPSGDRIDVVGWCRSENLCKGKSIAVEVEITSPLQRDISRLVASGFELKFVVIGDPSLRSIPYRIGDIIAVYYEHFEDALRLELGIPLTKPSFTEPAQLRIVESVDCEKALEEFRAFMEAIGLRDLTLLVEDALLKLYLASADGAVPVEVEVEWERIPGDVLKFELFPLNRQALAVLLQKGLAVKGRTERSYKDGIKTTLYLSNEARALGGCLLRERIKRYKEILQATVNKYGPKLVFTACIAFGSSVRSPTTSRIWLQEDPYINYLANLLPWSAPEIVDYEVRKALAKIARAPTPVKLSCWYLARLPRVLGIVLGFYRDLVELGFAVKAKIWGSGGEILGENISTAKLVMEVVMELVAGRGFPSEGVVRGINELMVLWKSRDVPVGPSFYELLVTHGVKVEELVQLLDELNSMKITSKYIGIEGRRPFIVIDEAKFAEYVVKKLKEVEEAFLNELYEKT